MISVRLRRAMLRLGVSTLEQLATKTVDDLLELDGVGGVTTVLEARKLLAAHGLNFANSYPLIETWFKFDMARAEQRRRFERLVTVAECCHCLEDTGEAR